MGKGSKMRPMDKQRFNDNFDRIFKKEEKTQKKIRRDNADFRL
jgi:hypothetical protein